MLTNSGIDRPGPNGVMDEIQSFRASGVPAVSEGRGTSYRSMFTGPDRNISSSQRRNGLVLFVKPNDTDGDQQSRNTGNREADNTAAEEAQALLAVENESESTDDGANLVSVTVDVSMKALTWLQDGVVHASSKPLLATAFILFYFILLDIVLLYSSGHLNDTLRSLRAADNEGLVLLATSLSHQLRRATNHLDSIQSLRNQSEIEMNEKKRVEAEVKALENTRNRCLSVLQAKLVYNGASDDLLFLMEEYISYETQLEVIAREELQWLSAVDSSVSSAEKARLESHDEQKFLGASRENSHGSLHSTVTKAEVGRNVPFFPPLAKRSRRNGDDTAYQDDDTVTSRLLWSFQRVLRNKFVGFLCICALLVGIIRSG